MIDHDEVSNPVPSPPPQLLYCNKIAWCLNPGSKAEILFSFYGAKDLYFNLVSIAFH